MKKYVATFWGKLGNFLFHHLVTLSVNFKTIGVGLFHVYFKSLLVSQISDKYLIVANKWSDSKDGVLEIKTRGRRIKMMEDTYKSTEPL